MVEVESAEHPRSVSQDGTRWPLVTPGGGSPASACLAASAVPDSHLALGHGVISCSPLLSPSLISLPAASLGPGQLRRDCGRAALLWLWVSDGWIVRC